MAVIKGNVKAQGMSAHIGTWQQSGLSQAEYCRLNGLTEQSFGYWLRKIRNQASVELVPLNIPADFAIRTHLRQGLSGLCLNFGMHVTMEIARDFDAETFARVIKVIATL